MTKQNNITTYFSYSIIVIAALSAITGISAVFTDFPPTRVIIASFCLILIYMMAIIADEETEELQWTGFTRLVLVVGWMIFGLSSASFIAIAGTLLAYIYIYPYSGTVRDTNRVNALLSNFVNSNASLLGMHLIYILMYGVLPAINASGAYPALPALMLALPGGSLISIILISFIQKISFKQITSDVYQYVMPELPIILAGFVLPVIFVQVNLLVFVIILVFIAMWIYRQAQVTQSDTELKRRIQEMTTLNNLGATMASQLSIVSTLESVHRELDNLLNATTIYIALYDEDQNTLDYRLVMVDGEEIVWEKQKLTGGLTEFVIREKEAICYTHEEIRRRFKNLYDVSVINDRQYMIAPLRVSTKVIGVLGLSHASRSDAFSGHDFSLFQTIASQASLALRNATLYDRTVQLADNLSIINQSLQDMMFNFEHGEALRKSCEIAISITGASKAAIFLLESDFDNQMKLVESIGFGDVEFVNYQDRLFQHNARVITNIATSTENDLKELARAGQFSACVQIPLRSGNSIVGTLDVYHDMPYFYDATELNLLEMLTNQITAALDNADLLQALELYAAEQAQLVHLSRISGSTLELDLIIKDVCSVLAQMMRVSRVAIGIWNTEKNNLRIASPDGVSFDLRSSELGVQAVPEIEHLLQENGVSALQIFHADNQEYSAGLADYMSANGDATLGLIPMQLHETVIGLIVLGNMSKHHFSDNDFRLLEMANHQITAQIHNAQVHTRTGEQLVNRLEQLELIEDIAQQISEALEIDLIIQNVLEAALQATQADFAAIALVDRDNANIFDIIWREVVDDRLIPDRITLELESGVVGHVVKTGEMMIIPENADFDAYVPPMSENNYRGTLALPMRTGNKVIGVLNLESIHPDFFTLEQASFIKSLAGHAAISIDNANLLVERERQINVLTLLRELSLDALSMMQADDISQAVLRTALILLNGDETTLYSYDANHKIDVIASIQSKNGQIENTTALIPATLLHETVKKGSLRFVSDVSELALYDKDNIDWKDVKQRSLIIMPVARRNQVHEILCIGFYEKRKFSHDELNMVDLLAVQVAGHLENATLNQEITSSHDRMRAILDSTRDGIILLNNEEQIQDANSAASDLTGIDLQAYLFKPLSNIAHLSSHAEQSASTWHNIAETYQDSPASIHNQEFAFLHDDNNIVQVRMLVTDVVDETKEIVGRLLVLRDITEEKKLQEFRDTMQSMVLHDLRGPLTAIVTSMYVAENILALYGESDKFDELKEGLTTTFAVSLSSAEDMLRQVDTLRDLPMMNMMQVKPQEIPMYDIANTAYSSLSANFIDSNIAVELAIEPEHLVFVDESLIRRVIVNLMHNAFKFTPVDGKVLVHLIDNVDEAGYVTIQVADTGPGIPESQRERIFGQFIQIEGQKPRAGGKGTGLGLNFCKLAVEAHGGQIQVAADGPLSGACFSFTIPKFDWRKSSQSDNS